MYKISTWMIIVNEVLMYKIGTWMINVNETSLPEL